MVRQNSSITKLLFFYLAAVKNYMFLMSIISTNKLSRIRRDIVASMLGNDIDFTAVSLKRAIFMLAIPMVLEMVMESIFALADIFFVSKLGADAVAGVGITESMLTIIYALGVGMSMATTALVARRIGEKNPEQASVAAFQAIVASIFISVLPAIAGIFFAKDLLRFMGASEQIISETYLYTAIIIGSNAVIMLLFVMNSVFRSSGDAAISMRVLWIANIINIVLDPCLIFGLGPFPELGVKGAAIATSIGRGIGVLLQLYYLLNGKHRIKLALRHFKISFAIMFKLFKLSLGAIAQHIIATSSWIIMVRLITSFGSEVIAGYTIAIRIIIFTILPSWGLSNAASTLVGQNLGAKRPDRAERSVWITGISNTILMAFIAIILVVFAPNFMRLFIADNSVVESGVLCLRVIGAGLIIYGFGMVIVQSFNGAGDTTTPTIINIFCFWLTEIPLAYLLAYTVGLDELGVYIAIVGAEALMVLIGIIIFRQGKWKLREV